MTVPPLQTREEIQRKSRVREWTPQNAPWIHTGATKKVQEAELKKNSVINPTIQDISTAVISIRNSKLPNPKVLGNCGSFFKNPVITYYKFKILKEQFPKIPHYIVSDTTVKIPAGWLIEIAGFKGKKFGNYGVHDKQALVLVNYGNASGKDLLELSIQIQKAVLIIFGSNLESEVNILQLIDILAEP